MWEQVGLIRNGEGLKDGARRASRRSAGGRRRRPCPAAATYNLAWQDWLNLRKPGDGGLADRAERARARRERGSHYRSDPPEPAADLYNVYVRAEERTGPRVWTEPVRLSRLRPSGTPAAPAAVEVGD